MRMDLTNEEISLIKEALTNTILNHKLYMSNNTFFNEEAYNSMIEKINKMAEVSKKLNNLK
jgi:hypothetical protein